MIKVILEDSMFTKSFCDVSRGLATAFLSFSFCWAAYLKVSMILTYLKIIKSMLFS